jgi:hypothetical protein
MLIGCRRCSLGDRSNVELALGHPLHDGLFMMQEEAVLFGLERGDAREVRVVHFEIEMSRFSAMSSLRTDSVNATMPRWTIQRSTT